MASNGYIPLSKGLVGTWELLSREDITPSGERRIDSSLAADPFGLLFYDNNGNFTAQIMKRDRDASTPEIDQQAAANTRRAEGCYHTHFGAYSVDDTEGTVSQGLVGVLQSCAPCGGDVSGSRLGVERRQLPVKWCAVST